MHNIDYNLTSEVVKRINKTGVKKIILFGSFVRGEVDSDIDLIIIKDTKERFVKRLLGNKKFCRPSCLSGCFVYIPSEFDSMLNMNNPFTEYVAREGKVIYEE